MKSRAGVGASAEKQRETYQAVGPGASPCPTLLGAFVAGLIPFALAFAVYLLVFLEMRPGSTGDEPHYLVTAQSIAYDLDVDLRNNYTDRDRVLRVVNVFPLGPHAAVYKESGELRPFRSVGLPAVLAPAVRLGGLDGARLVMILIAALVADQLWRLLRELRLRARYRLLAWAAVVFCLPLIVFTSQVYPELAGALLVLITLRLMVVAALRPAALAFGSCAAVALLWLHVRYLSLSVSLCVGLAVAACIQGWSPGKRQPGLRGAVVAVRTFAVRCAAVLTKQWRTVTLPVVVPYVIGIGLLAAAYQHWYGSPNLQSSYRAYGSPSVGTGHWDFWYQFALRDILDPVVGWIPFAPVHWLGFAALGCLVLRFGWPAAGCVAAAAGYELVISSVGTGSGFGFPARYPMIIVPLIAVPLAVALQKIRPARLIFVPLMAVSLIFAVVAVRNYGQLYPGDIQRMFGMRSTAPAFPRLNELVFQTSFILPPDGPPRPATGKVEAGQVVAREERDAAGFVRHGPYAALTAGAYQAIFTLAAAGAGPEEPIATIEVVGAPDSVLARTTVTRRQLRPRRLTDIQLPFGAPGGQLVETRVFYHDRGTLRVGPIIVGPIVVPRPETHFRDWPLAFMWVAGTFLVGWLFVELMRLRPRKTSIDA